MHDKTLIRRIQVGARFMWCVLLGQALKNFLWTLLVPSGSEGLKIGGNARLILYIIFFIEPEL